MLRWIAAVSSHSKKSLFYAYCELNFNNNYKSTRLALWFFATLHQSCYFLLCNMSWEVNHWTWDYVHIRSHLHGLSYTLVLYCWEKIRFEVHLSMGWEVLHSFLAPDNTVVWIGVPNHRTPQVKKENLHTGLSKTSHRPRNLIDYRFHGVAVIQILLSPQTHTQCEKLVGCRMELKHKM